MDRLFFRRTVFILAGFLATGSALADPANLPATWVLEGRTFHKVRVQSVTPVAVTIFHAKGIAQLPLVELPADYQEALGYDYVEAQLFELEEEMRQASAKPSKPPRAAQRSVADASRPSRAVGAQTVVFRREVDLRPLYIEHNLHTKDQGLRPSCSIFAVVSALELEEARKGRKAVPLSEEFLIWATRQLHPDIPINDGYHFNEVISALQTYGVAPHRLVPNTFGRSIEEIKPGDEAIEAARQHRDVVTQWFRPDNPHLLERIVEALNREKPVIVGVRWPAARTVARSPLLSNQTPLENGGHAVTLIGYRSPSGRAEDTTFIFRNSFGNEWGVAGCGFMTAEYLQKHLITALSLDLP